MILLAGLPGAGKTTFAHELTRSIPAGHAVHIESDAIRRALTDTPRYTVREHAWVFARAEQLADDALAAGRHVILDATNLTRKDRRRFVRLANRTGATLIPVHLTAPESVIRERLAQPRTGFSQANIAVFEMMNNSYQPFAGPTIEVDTREDLAPAIAAVTFAIRAASPSP